MYGPGDWRLKQVQAVARTKRHERDFAGSVLIMIDSQPPLEKHALPNREYVVRLQEGRKLVYEQHELGYKVTLYLPGSRAEGDAISLSQAAQNYLQTLGGLPEGVQILGDEINDDRLEGVYNTADAAERAAGLFKTHQYGRIIVLIGKNQLTRARLHFAWFGVVPKFRVVPAPEYRRSMLGELGLTVWTYLLDPDWQDQRRLMARWSRRRPQPRSLRR